MPWERLMLYPLSAELFEWVYSQPLTVYGDTAQTESEHFLLRLIAFELDNTYYNPEYHNNEPRKYLFNSVQIAEWEVDNAEFDEYQVIGKNKTVRFTLLNPATDISIQLPLTPRIGEYSQGRVIGVRRVGRRFRPNRYINHYTNDRMAIAVFQWIQPSGTHTSLEQRLLEIEYTLGRIETKVDDILT